MSGRWGRRLLLSGEPLAEFAPGLSPLPGEPVFEKDRYSAFAATGLGWWLEGTGAGALVICGAVTHLCCQAAAWDAMARDMVPVMASDACAGRDSGLHGAVLEALEHAGAVVTCSRTLAAGISPAAAPAPGPPCARREAVIIGAGPAGLAAAAHLARCGVPHVLLEKGSPGGLLSSAWRVENLPGSTGPLAGEAAAGIMVWRAAASGAAILHGEALSVETSREGLLVRLADGRSLEAPSVVVATGTVPDPAAAAGLPPLPEGLLHRDVREVERITWRPPVLVLGGGDAAFDHALRLHDGGFEVVLAHRAASPGACRRLVEAAEREVRVMPSTVLAASGEMRGAVCGLTLAGPDGTSVMEAGAVLAAFGRVPTLPLLPPGAGTRTNRSCRTPVEGLYLAGDAGRGRDRQAAIAAADGLAAAMDIASSGRRAWCWK
jgi:thioredoxin reductase (NADPH)